MISMAVRVVVDRPARAREGTTDEVETVTRRAQKVWNASEQNGRTVRNGLCTERTIESSESEGKRQETFAPHEGPFPSQIKVEVLTADKNAAAAAARGEETFAFRARARPVSW